MHRFLGVRRCTATLGFDVQPRWGRGQALLFLRTFNSSLSGRKASDRDSAWGTANVVQADLVAEVDRLGITAVFPADA